MVVRATILGLAVAAVFLLGQPHVRAHNYPTATLGDYLFACMAANGQTKDALEKCACSVDVIASILPHEEYVQAETMLRMRQVRGGGEKMALFRDTPMAKEAVEKLKRAQVEAEARCF